MGLEWSEPMNTERCRLECAAEELVDLWNHWLSEGWYAGYIDSLSQTLRRIAEDGGGVFGMVTLDGDDAAELRRLASEVGAWPHCSWKHPRALVYSEMFLHRGNYDSAQKGDTRVVFERGVTPCTSLGLTNLSSNTNSPRGATGLRGMTYTPSGDRLQEFDEWLSNNRDYYGLSKEALPKGQRWLVGTFPDQCVTKYLPVALGCVQVIVRAETRKKALLAAASKRQQIDATPRWRGWKVWIRTCELQYWTTEWIPGHDDSSGQTIRDGYSRECWDSVYQSYGQEWDDLRFRYHYCTKADTRFVRTLCGKKVKPQAQRRTSAQRLKVEWVEECYSAQACPRCHKIYRASGDAGSIFSGHEPEKVWLSAVQKPTWRSGLRQIIEEIVQRC